MSRLYKVLIVLLFLVVLGSYATADELNQYRLESVGLRISLPGTLDVLTRTTRHDDPLILQYNYSDFTTMYNEFAASNLYLSAYTQDLSYEIAVHMFIDDTSIGQHDFNRYSTDELIDIGYQLAALYSEDQVYFQNIETYIHPDVLFIRSDYHYTAYGYDYYTREYHTVYNGKAIYISMYSYDGNFTEERLILLSSIIDKLVFENQAFSQEVQEDIQEHGYFLYYLHEFGYIIFILILFVSASILFIPSPNAQQGTTRKSKRLRIILISIIGASSISLILLYTLY